MKKELFTCAQTGLIRDAARERATYGHRIRQVIRAAEGLRKNEIARICARYELEPDEFFTAEQKATG